MVPLTINFYNYDNGDHTCMILLDNQYDNGLVNVNDIHCLNSLGKTTWSGLSEM